MVDKGIYLIEAEKVRENRVYLSVETYKGVKWGFQTMPPVPSWYPFAKDVLAHAIELAPEQESLWLYVNTEKRDIKLVSLDHKFINMLDEVLVHFIGDKRRERKDKKLKKK